MQSWGCYWCFWLGELAWVVTVTPLDCRESQACGCHWFVGWVSFHLCCNNSGRFWDDSRHVYHVLSQLLIRSLGLWSLQGRSWFQCWMKVAEWLWEKWYGHILVYEKQREVMQKILWKGSNSQLQLFNKRTSGALCWKGKSQTLDVRLSWGTN